ncbi:hypothetical protein BpOF4_19085 [Alkalihalophilus pseudofirmus OF4]|uniref:Uncharacterized protein n=2 Tax=Alkalihalophilus pseudofirmus TaxID=79885 RepID=D3FSZ1_ALKPO|nr:MULTISPECIES: hypothetical protein [Alkalihalophilus]ADC51856.1 hypothetical protein BpOF4_19085 [Alkalihalophilus pseudofirmus OF4]MDV2885108.1 hypothetical protein [Alkalihalophilus pseudofirmus]MED1599708.1 hypothetical protein [Alkalihalophilus marmarensis]WEG15461.1 hypothetical protein PQ478_13035 [Alkalihalophilus pseudofirmus]
MAAKKKSSKAKHAPKKTPSEKYAFTQKMVTSETCIKCSTPCARGMAYVEKMKEPGAVGKGVPCHLTKGKGFK